LSDSHLITLIVVLSAVYGATIAAIVVAHEHTIRQEFERLHQSGRRA
jgi:hypothetical protein